MNQTQSANLKLAVLIDADNASADIIELLLEDIKKYGTTCVKRIYGNWKGTRLKKWDKVLLANAIQPVHIIDYTKGKNSSDIGLVIDAMDLLYSDTFDIFCLVSSDSDFSHLAFRIRESGKTVYGFGENKTPEAFRRACDKFFLYPIINNNKQTTATKKQTTATKKQTTATKKQTTATKKQTTATNKQTTATNKQTTATNKQTTATNKQTTATNKQPTATNKQTTATNKQPTATNKQPTATNKQPTATNKQTTATNKQTTTKNKEQIKQTDKQLFSDDKLVEIIQELVANHHSPDEYITLQTLGRHIDAKDYGYPRLSELILAKKELFDIKKQNEQLKSVKLKNKEV